MTQPTSITPPPPDPHNIQATKYYIFNETGNIMLASTALASDEISQSVRDVFAEVAVFFAAMTKAMTTTIDPLSKQPYSIYDYKAIEGIVDGSGLFVHVTEEDVSYENSSFGADFSKNLIEALLGLATGEGALSFAQGMIASMGKRGLKIGASSWKSSSEVANIVFVCEYLLGMPVVSAIVVSIDASKSREVWSAGPCIQGSSSKMKMVMHKDTYMFVTPKFIREYSGDLEAAETDLKFLEFVDYLRSLIERTPIITGVVSDDGNAAPLGLEPGKTYFILGSFLGSKTGELKFWDGSKGVAGQGSITPGEWQPNVVSFSVSGKQTTALPIGVFASKTATAPIVATPSPYTVAASAPVIPSEDSEAKLRD